MDPTRLKVDSGSAMSKPLMCTACREQQFESIRVVFGRVTLRCKACRFPKALRLKLWKQAAPPGCSCNARARRGLGLH